MAVPLARAGGSESTQTPKRLVILKVDGLPAGLLERFVREHDPVSGKSRLPWIDNIFRLQGATLQNFYVRGISLSVPSWSLLDTGQQRVFPRGSSSSDPMIA